MTTKTQPRRGSRHREMVVNAAWRAVDDALLLQRIKRKLTSAEVVWILAQSLKLEATRNSRLKGAK